MKSTAILICIALAIIVTTVATSRSDTAPTEEERPTNAGAAPEPISGVPAMPIAGSARPMKDPFAPHATGQEADPQTLWTYESLNAAERQVVDRGVADDYGAVNDAYASAARARAVHARAEGAAGQLGIDNLDSVGVVK